MRRTASQVIRSLEARVARLERQAGGYINLKNLKIPTMSNRVNILSQLDPRFVKKLTSEVKSRSRGNQIVYVDAYEKHSYKGESVLVLRYSTDGRSYGFAAIDLSDSAIIGLMLGERGFLPSWEIKELLVGTYGEEYNDWEEDWDDDDDYED